MTKLEQYQELKGKVVDWLNKGSYECEDYSRMYSLRVKLDKTIDRINRANGIMNLTAVAADFILEYQNIEESGLKDYLADMNSFINAHSTYDSVVLNTKFEELYVIRTELILRISNSNYQDEKSEARELLKNFDIIERLTD